MPEDKEPHGNSKKSKKEQHLYEIYDSKSKKTVKYGISGSKLNKDGSSSRANLQINLLNKLDEYLRYLANVLVTKIKGRKKALETEQQYVNDFATNNNGNPPRDQKRPLIKNKKDENE